MPDRSRSAAIASSHSAFLDKPTSAGRVPDIHAPNVVE
jgi:hypothetical protein